jgi:hypothetical protein
MQQNATPLSASQETAMQALLSGEQITAAAKTAKVNRSTLHRWLKEPEFLAVLNACRSELREAQQHRLARLASSAIEVIEQALEEGDARTALAVLRGIGLLDGQAPHTGPTNADRIRYDQANEQKSLEFYQSRAGT